MTDRRKDPRFISLNYHERRRAAALEQQQRSRSGAMDAARKAFIKDVPTPSMSQAETQQPSPPISDGATLSLTAVGTPSRQKWSDQLMLPEWMIDVPSDLATEWLVMPRPEGQRCIVIAAQCHTTARLRNGAIADKFPSGLPGGGPNARGGDKSVLDCIYHSANQTYYVLDILRWRSRDIEDCTSEFRLYWAASQLKEDLDTAPEVLSPLTNVRHFATLPVFQATPAGIRSAYSGPVPFTRDGLYFVHRSAMYQFGQTPLALVWKDPHCSRYFVDTDPSGVPLREQHMILKYCQDRSVVTSDDQPVALAVMPESFVKEVGPSRLPAGSLLRFRIGPRGISFASDGSPVGADLHFLGFASQQRGRADSLSKVVFQHMARAGPLKIETLLAVATTSENAGAAWLGEGKMSSIGVERGQAGLQEENSAGMAIG